MCCVVQCGIDEIAIGFYLDAASRTWRITDTVLDDIDNDLQRLVDCTEEGDTILFDVTGMIVALAKRVTIRWPLTITADIEDRELVDGIFPEAPSRATMVCPYENEGIFLVKFVAMMALSATETVVAQGQKHHLC